MGLRKDGAPEGERMGHPVVSRWLISGSELDYTTALRLITSLYHSALSFGVRFWVLKST